MYMFGTSRLDAHQSRRRDQLRSDVRAGVPPPDAQGGAFASVCVCVCVVTSLLLLLLLLLSLLLLLLMPPPPQEESARLQSNAQLLREPATQKRSVETMVLTLLPLTVWTCYPPDPPPPLFRLVLSAQS